MGAVRLPPTRFRLRLGCIFLLGVKPVHCPTVTSRNEITVDIDSHLDAGMPQLLLYIYRTLSLTQEQTRIGVPDVMESHLSDTHLAVYPLEDPPDVVLLHMFSILVEHDLHYISPARSHGLPLSLLNLTSTLYLDCLRGSGQ